MNKLFIAASTVASVLAFASSASAQVPISNLPTGTTPLTGAELAIVVQNGKTVKVPASALINQPTQTFTGQSFSSVIGVNVSGTASAGYIPIATSGTAAAWGTTFTASTYAMGTGLINTQKLTLYSLSGTGSAGAVISWNQGGAGVGDIGGHSAVFGGTYSGQFTISGYNGLEFYTNNVKSAAIDNAQNISLDGPTTIAIPSGLSPALTITQTLTGNAGATNWGSWTVASDNVAGAFLVDFNRTHSFGGSAATGTRVIDFDWLIQTAATSSGNTSRSYVGAGQVSQTNSGDGGTNTGAGALGAYFGINPQVRCGAANIYNCVGAEFDNETTASFTGHYNFGISIVNFAAVQGVTDAGIVFYSGGQIATSGGGGPWGPGVGFKEGIMFAELGNNGLVPISSGGTVLGTHLETLSNIPVTNGIDLRGFLISGLGFAATGNTGLPAAQTGSLVQIGAANSTATGYELVSYAAGNQFRGVRGNGTFASPTGLVADNQIVAMNAFGYYDATHISTPAATFRCFSGETWSATAWGSYCSVATTPNTTATITEALRIFGSGGLGVGTTTDPGTGAMRATGAIRSDSTFNLNGSAGSSRTCTVNQALTLIFTGGILTGGTCNS